MPNNVVHFAIHADDVARAKQFYGDVFGWSFEPWGPPNFYLITTGTDEDRGIRGALQERREPLGSGAMNGYECTVSVESVDAIAAAVEQHGGKVVMPKTSIPGVGTLIQFQDTESNVACAMQYEPGVV